MDAPATFRKAYFQLKRVVRKTFAAFEIIGDVSMLSTFSTLVCGRVCIIFLST